MVRRVSQTILTIRCTPCVGQNIRNLSHDAELLRAEQLEPFLTTQAESPLLCNQNPEPALTGQPEPRTFRLLHSQNLLGLSRSVAVVAAAVMATVAAAPAAGRDRCGVWGLRFGCIEPVSGTGYVDFSDWGLVFQVREEQAEMPGKYHTSAEPMVALPLDSARRRFLPTPLNARLAVFPQPQYRTAAPIIYCIQYLSTLKTRLLPSFRNIVSAPVAKDLCFLVKYSVGSRA